VLWVSSAASASFRVGRTRPWSGLRSLGSEPRELFSMARPWSSVCVPGEPRCAAVSRSGGDVENSFAGGSLFCDSLHSSSVLKFFSKSLK